MIFFLEFYCSRLLESNIRRDSIVFFVNIFFDRNIILLFFNFTFIVMVPLYVISLAHWSIKLILIGKV